VARLSGLARRPVEVQTPQISSQTVAVCVIYLNNDSAVKGDIVASAGEITRLLTELKGGNPQAQAELIPLVYEELRRVARNYMRREKAGHTLQPTALVNEAYLRLVEGPPIDWQNRAHFFAVAAQLMRRVLVDHARARGALKRGGNECRVSLHDQERAEEKDADLLALDQALERLAERDPRQARIVESRFFGGLSEKEAAAVLGISVRTVKRDWSVARAWLFKEIRKGAEGKPARSQRG